MIFQDEIDKGYEMKAFVYEAYGPASVLKLMKVQKPNPKSDEVLIKIEANSINPADWRRMVGEPRFLRLSTGLFSPKDQILGADVAGVVEAVGEHVTRLKIGDAVFGEISLGGFAEYVCVREDLLELKPNNLSFAEATAVPLAGNTALQALRDKGNVQPGQTVLINGASGGVGTFVVQIAKAFGAHVTAVCSTRNVELVKRIGADEVIDYTKEDFAKNGRSYDLILDIVGNRTLADYKTALNPTGTCVMIGFTTLPHMFKVMVQGSWHSRRTQQKILILNAEINREDLKVLRELIESGKVKPVIDKTYPFMKLPDAVDYVFDGHARGKVVVAIGS